MRQFGSELVKDAVKVLWTLAISAFGIDIGPLVIEAPLQSMPFSCPMVSLKVYEAVLGDGDVESVTSTLYVYSSRIKGRKVILMNFGIFIDL